MSSGKIHETIASEYTEKFGRPLSVSVMNKLKKFPMLQELGYNGQLGFQKKDFHGLKEFNVHMEKYSNTNPLLKAAWKAIKMLAPKNPYLELKLFLGGALGKVGLLFKSIHNFDKVFSINANEVLDPDKIAKKINGEA
jgi:hypothetical protein